VPTYRIHDTTGNDLGLIEHPAPNVEPGTARVKPPGPLAGLLEVWSRPPTDERRRDSRNRLASYLRIEERELDAGGLN
jgi:hypothetical protein